MILILLVQATTFIQSSLLLRCGDIESNPGPGIYPGKVYYMYSIHWIGIHCNMTYSYHGIDLDYDDVNSSIVLSKCYYIAYSCNTLIF